MMSCKTVFKPLGRIELKVFLNNIHDDHQEFYLFSCLHRPLTIYNINVTAHPSLLIDLKLKGHLHRYKLHQIFQFFMGFLMVPLLKRKVWRFFRAGPNGPSPPTCFWQQNSAIPPPSSHFVINHMTCYKFSALIG